MAMFYNTVIAWSVYYLFISFTPDLPWKYCNREWNTLCCLPIEKIKFSNFSIENNEYQQIDQNSYVYKVSNLKNNGIKNRIVMYNTNINNDLDILKVFFTILYFLCH